MVRKYKRRKRSLKKLKKMAIYIYIYIYTPYWYMKYIIHINMFNDIWAHISIIILNENKLNAPTKRHRMAEWMQKQDPSICCLQETHLKPKVTYRLKVRGWKNIFHAAAAKSRQLCPTLCNPIDCSPKGSSVLGTLQVRTLE